VEIDPVPAFSTSSGNPVWGGPSECRAEGRTHKREKKKHFVVLKGFVGKNHPEGPGRESNRKNNQYGEEKVNGVEKKGTAKGEILWGPCKP